MGSRMLVMAATIGVGLAAAASCKSDSFACLSDAQCQTDGKEAWCESTGYCSFPDDACPSGRTYGEFSPEGFADMCVPVDVAGTEGDDDATSLGDGSGEADATVADGSEDGAETGMTDATGGETFECSDALTDDFEDGVLGVQWSVFSTDPTFEAWLQETGGALQVTMPEGADGFVGILSSSLLALDNGRIRLDLERLPGPASLITVAVGATDPDSPGIVLYIYETYMALAYQVDAATIEPLGDAVFLDAAQRYIELQFASQGGGRTVVLRASTDGETFTEVASESHDAPLGDSVLYYYVTSSDPTTQTGDTVRLESIEACQG